MSEGIGARVARALPPGRTQKQVAASVGMTPDAFSRALRGERGFSAVELADLAELLGEDLHYLITGTPDPHRLVLAARHAYDQETRERSVSGHAADRAVLNDICLAYLQAGDLVPAAAPLPTSLAQAREALGEGFVGRLLDRLERCGIDVVRLPDLGTSYAFWAAGRPVVAVPSTGNWFRENWDMAHELAHLVLGHRNVLAGDGGRTDACEREANAFAADLLLPARRVGRIDWTTVGPAQVADLVWEWGVSTQALATRLAGLRRPVGAEAAAALRLSTPALLRRHRTRPGAADEVTHRMQAASARHFPLWLQEAHLDLIARGAVQEATLAWMLGVPAESLEVDAPPPPAECPPARLEALLG